MSKRFLQSLILHSFLSYMTNGMYKIGTIRDISSTPLLVVPGDCTRYNKQMVVIICIYFTKTTYILGYSYTCSVIFNV